MPKPVRRKAVPQPAVTQQATDQSKGAAAGACAAATAAAAAAEAEQRPLTRMQRMAVESGIDAADMEQYF